MTTTLTTMTTTQDPTNKDAPLSLAPPLPQIDLTALAANIREMNTWHPYPNDDEEDFSMTMMPYLPTPMTPTSNNSPLPAVPAKHNPKQSADDDEDEDSPMTTMTIQPTTLPPTRAHHPIPEPTTHHLSHPHSNNPTTHWINTAFDPVFHAMDRLARKFLTEVINNLSHPEPPSPKPSTNRWSHSPQVHCRSPHKQYPLQHCQLSTRHPSHFHMTIPAHPSITAPNRYMAHNFLPP